MFLLILTTGLIIWAWIENISNLDIFLKRRVYFQYDWKVEIEKTADSVSLSKNTIALLESLNQRYMENNKTTERVMELLTWSSLFAISSVILVIIELIKRRKN